MKTPRWWLILALSLFASGIVGLIIFMLLVWPPGAVLVLAIVLLATGALVDVPRKPRGPRAP